MEGKRIAEVYSEIQIKRFEMIEIAEMYGLTDDNTIRTSQELDQLMNEYHYLKYSAS
ncbi:aspartyl-phosphate phosphatase Spo0E family protein [Bacillus sp. V59.32b]|uniref:aspartyl-phosphate phosphatase Spo0E family protein n=1 Tax=Bacillus sp. V59.32b TaxID=1758642 RepID=UPI000E3CB58E|nr:aspartyl-phosphate phosphatase Spo0E family protein [Bacillus sp. V59.32b]RFU69933.1 aspartyl-phosphate phosphatase Spo0E family protein [Bacillus sp. V59.32b]